MKWIFDNRFMKWLYENILGAISLLGVVVISFLSIWMFFYKFDGELSNQHSHWSAFGSYISGTFAACLAVIWLVISVAIQRKEFKSLKVQLKHSAKSQAYQVKISALSALITANNLKIADIIGNRQRIYSGQGAELYIAEMSREDYLNSLIVSEGLLLEINKDYESQLIAINSDFDV